MLDSIRTLVQSDLTGVNRLIADELKSEVPLIKELNQHIFLSGGKRLRPLVLLLSAKACGYNGIDHIPLAASVEFFHTATLLHDDVVDHSELRRGNKTANAIWGNKVSVLVGDYLFTRAFQIMVRSENVSALKVLADASNLITQGEVMQLMNCNDPNTTQERYMDVIRHKTATLFQAAAKIGAILAERSPDEIQALTDYGLHLGNAFQLVDDALDYCSDAKTMGKNIGDDLADGKPTLPLIYAMEKGSLKQRQLIQESIQNSRFENMNLILEAIQSTEAIAYTYRVAEQEVDHAMTCLMKIPKSPYRDALEQLIQFALSRKY
ncbi:MAG: polyprenyl synthetase family protein [Proteobacteria bacterium]|nr:polyprenyl synthetase family protein [Pseudomonadota bacterium]